MNRSQRKILAEETLQYIEQGFYINKNSEKVHIEDMLQNAISNTDYHTSENMNTILEPLELKATYSTIFEVIEETTIESILRNVSDGYTNPMCLNFASAFSPGGGFLNGSQAQEESIARVSGLYLCQINAFAFYETHRRNQSYMFSDGMIYSPSVPIIRKDNGDMLDTPVISSIITAAAVNKGKVMEHEPDRKSDIESVMKKRIDILLGISALNNHKVLILGAWGCGVFQNDPKEIAHLFFELLMTKYQGVFEKVVFAIYAKNKKFIEAFQNELEKYEY